MFVMEYIAGGVVIKCMLGAFCSVIVFSYFLQLTIQQWALSIGFRICMKRNGIWNMHRMLGRTGVLKKRLFSILKRVFKLRSRIALHCV